MKKVARMIRILVLIAIACASTSLTEATTSAPTLLTNTRQVGDSGPCEIDFAIQMLRLPPMEDGLLDQSLEIEIYVEVVDYAEGKQEEVLLREKIEKDISSSDGERIEVNFEDELALTIDKTEYTGTELWINVWAREVDDAPAIIPGLDEWFDNLPYVGPLGDIFRDLGETAKDLNKDEDAGTRSLTIVYSEQDSGDHLSFRSREEDGIDIYLKFNPTSGCYAEDGPLS